jgi:hypothetical protein
MGFGYPEAKTHKDPGQPLKGCNTHGSNSRSSAGRLVESLARDAIEPRDAEAAAMVNPPRDKPVVVNNTAAPRSNITVAESAANPIMVPFEWQHTMEGKHCPKLEKLCRNGYMSNKTLKEGFSASNETLNNPRQRDLPCLMKGN